MNAQVHKRPLARKVPPVAIVTHRWRPLEDSMKELGRFLLNNWVLDVEMDNLKPLGAPARSSNAGEASEVSRVVAPVSRFPAAWPPACPINSRQANRVLAEGQCASRRLCQVGFTKGRRSLCKRFTFQTVEVCSRLCMSERARLAEVPYIRHRPQQ
jgi:hypothetical protein